MLEVWNGLTDSQSSLLSTVVLVIAGGLGVLLGAALFGGRVRDLKSALDASNEAIQKHQAQTTQSLADMEEQLSVTLSALTQLRSSVSDIRNDVEEGANNVPDQLRQQLKTHWYNIRDELQKRAGSLRIHGRTRARYASFTNNQIGTLLQAMKEDGNIEPADAAAFKQAHDIWTWHRNGKPELPEADVRRMRELAIALVPDYVTN